MIATEQLISHWRAQRLPLAKGVKESELYRFEAEHSFRLPTDVREYFTTTNGMVQRGGADCDKEGFAFWPLEQVKPMPIVCADNDIPVPDVDKPELYFVFADYMQWSWAYAIRLGEAENPVILVGTEDADVVASSFTEFVSFYVDDADALYVRCQEHVPGQ